MLCVFSGAFSGECPLLARALSFLGFVRTIFGRRTFGSKHFCLLFVFWCCTAYFLPSSCGFYLPKADRKFFFVLEARCTNNFRGRTFGSRHFCLLLMLWCCFSYVLPNSDSGSRKLSEKILFTPGGGRTRTIFGGELLVCYASSVFLVFWCCFAYAIIIWILLPESCPKNSLLPSGSATPPSFLLLPLLPLSLSPFLSALPTSVRNSYPSVAPTD